MARKSRQSFLKRQREARRAEKAALKRQKRMERRQKGSGEGIEGEGVEGEGVEGGPPIGEPFEIEPIGDTVPEPETVSEEAPADRES